MSASPEAICRPSPAGLRCVHLFPGQGDFSVRALLAAVRADRVLRTSTEDVFGQIDPVAGAVGLAPLSPWLLGPNRPTTRELAHATTGTAQLALFGAAMAIHRALCHSLGAPLAAVGVSFGEITALTAAGVFSVADGARVAHDLALLLGSCPGGLTLLTCSEHAARELIERSGAREVVVAVVNDDHCVVVAGPVASLARLEKAADAVTAPVRLPLSCTAHHPAQQAAAQAFAVAVRSRPRAEPQFPVYSAVAGRAYRDADEVPRLLSDSLVRPAVVPVVLGQAMRHAPDLFLEVGTGGALAASARRTLSRMHAVGGHLPPAITPLAEPGLPLVTAHPCRDGEA